MRRFKPFRRSHLSFSSRLIITFVSGIEIVFYFFFISMINIQKKRKWKHAYIHVRGVDDAISMDVYWECVRRLTAGDTSDLDFIDSMEERSTKRIRFFIRNKRFGRQTTHQILQFSLEWRTKRTRNSLMFFNQKHGVIFMDKCFRAEMILRRMCISNIRHFHSFNRRNEIYI